VFIFIFWLCFSCSSSCYCACLFFFLPLFSVVPVLPLLLSHCPWCDSLMLLLSGVSFGKLWPSALVPTLTCSSPSVVPPAPSTSITKQRLWTFVCKWTSPSARRTAHRPPKYALLVGVSLFSCALVHPNLFSPSFALAALALVLVLSLYLRSHSFTIRMRFSLYLCRTFSLSSLAMFPVSLSLSLSLFLVYEWW
jgi:hypothetical protein